MTATFAPAPVRRATPTAPRVRRHATAPVPARRVDERTYRRRRAVVGSVFVVLAALAGVAVHDVLAGPGGVPASAAGAQPAPTRIVLTARPGDTMWSIARDHHGAIDFETYLETLISRNGGAAIQAGQQIQLP